jgi:hypothetical protein
VLVVVAALGEPEQRNVGAQGLVEPEVEAEQRRGGGRAEPEPQAAARFGRVGRRSRAGAAGSSTIWAGRRAAGLVEDGGPLGS